MNTSTSTTDSALRLASSVDVPLLVRLQLLADEFDDGGDNDDNESADLMFRVIDSIANDETQFRWIRMVVSFDHRFIIFFPNIFEVMA